MSNNLMTDIREAKRGHDEYCKQKNEKEICLGVPIWEKVALTLKEASLYSNIGEDTLRKITNEKDCDFVFFVGNKRLIKRELFVKYIEKIYIV